MDEKEWLSGVDAEIQNHAEQDNPQSVPVPDFPALALFLAKSYGQMLKDRERLKAMIDAGVPIYTKEMALRDLTSTSIDYESERVQTSNISNIPLRIIELLDNGYVEKMNRKLRREEDRIGGDRHAGTDGSDGKGDFYKGICARIHLQPAEKSIQKEIVQPSDLRGQRGGIESSRR